MNQEQFGQFWEQLKAPLRAKWEQITDQYEELLARLAGVEIHVGEPVMNETISYPMFVEEPAPKARSAAKTTP